jgi:hypothetical protein
VCSANAFRLRAGQSTAIQVARDDRQLGVVLPEQRGDQIVVEGFDPRDAAFVLVLRRVEVARGGVAGRQQTSRQILGAGIVLFGIGIDSEAGAELAGGRLGA